VTMRLKNGQTYSREAQHAKGGPEFPLSEDELRSKFFDCAKEAIPAESAQRALEHIQRLETLDSVRPVCDLIRG
jgi:2-methylcitrate dehydratase PrpD